MATENERFGIDIHLLPNIEQENDRFPGSDLFQSGRRLDDGSEVCDLERIAGRENLQQALLMRFLTPLGALAHLGHPTYGSNLYQMIGELNNETNRNRGKLYILEALAQEPRVTEVISVEIITNRRRDPTRVEYNVRVRVTGEQDPISLTVPVNLT
jgi:phage baseplate assembly protein W